MTRAEELRARAARATQRTASAATEQKSQDAPSGQSAASAPPPSVIRAKPVRITADLSPQTYRALIAYAAGLAASQGRARVAHVHVIRALVAELVEDEELQAVIARRVRSQLDD